MPSQPLACRPSGHPNAQRGFTLLELMITLVVVGILAAIVLPSFLDQIRKSRRSEAISEISRVENAQERWRANNSTYSADVSSVAATGLRLTAGTTTVDNYDTPAGYYNISVSGNTGTAYTVRARARTEKGQQNDTNCQCLQVRWSGGTATYEAASMSGGACGTFSTTNTAACWRR